MRLPLRPALYAAFGAFLAGTALSQTLYPGKQLQPPFGQLSQQRIWLGPGDVTPFTAWYGLRGYSNAQCTGSVAAIKLRRASDNSESDFNILSTCNLDMASIVTFAGGPINPSRLFVRTFYNQPAVLACSGATCNLVQATAANQPEFILNCIGALPCLEATTTGQILASANNITPATGVVSFYSTSALVSGTGAPKTLRENGNNNRAGYTSSGSLVLIGGTSGNRTCAAPGDGVFASMAGAINGTDTFILCEGQATLSGTATGNTTANLPGGMIGVTGAPLRATEFGFVDNAAISQNAAGAIVTNAAGYRKQ